MPSTDVPLIKPKTSMVVKSLFRESLEGVGNSALKLIIQNLLSKNPQP
jgi:hypothetical protein